jgi:hypothetical protein
MIREQMFALPDVKSREAVVRVGAMRVGMKAVTRERSMPKLSQAAI